LQKQEAKTRNTDLSWYFQIAVTSEKLSKQHTPTKI